MYNATPELKGMVIEAYELVAKSKFGDDKAKEVVSAGIEPLGILFNRTVYNSLIPVLPMVELTKYKNLYNMLHVIKSKDSNTSGYNTLYTQLTSDIITDSYAPSLGDIESSITLLREIEERGIETSSTEEEEEENWADFDFAEFDINYSENEPESELGDELEVESEGDELLDGMDSDLLNELGFETIEVEETDEELVEEQAEEVVDEIPEEISEVEEDTESDDALAELARREEEEEKKRKAEIKEGKIAGTADDIDENNFDDDDSEALEQLVQNTVDNIMKSYAMIYEPLFRNPPCGVLYTDDRGNPSIMTVGNSKDNTGVKVHELNKHRMFVGPIYKVILSMSNGLIKEAPKVGDDGMDIKASWMNSDGTMMYNYCPHIQVRNCLGVYKDKKTGLLKRAKTWSEFKPKLSSEIKPTILALLKRTNRDDATRLKAAASIQKLYTTVLVMNEFDASKAFRLTVYSEDLVDKKLIGNIAQSIVSANPLLKPSYEIVSNEYKNGIQTILIVVDKQKYTGEINFAYKTLSKIIETGGSISLSSTVLGTRLNGQPYTLNLSAPTCRSLAIIAGSHSGKGVLTLTLLAAMYAAGCPVVYCDYKPDMAPTLWDMERSIPGSKILAIDAQINGTKESKPNRGKKYGVGCPESIYTEIGTTLSFIPYVKSVQLMNLIGQARILGRLDSSKKFFFILDELQRCGDALMEQMDLLKTTMAKYKPKKGETSEEYDYINRLMKVYDVKLSVNTFLDTNAGKGNMTAIAIGQVANSDNWKGPFTNMVKKCTHKLCGTGTVGNSMYGIDKKTPGSELITTGYFGACEGCIPTPENTEIIKTLLVLNENDFNAQKMEPKSPESCTGKLLGNLADKPDVMQDVMENDLVVTADNKAALDMGCEVGSANPLIGFEGLVRYIALKDPNFDMAQRVSAGYNECYKLLNLLGIVGPAEEGYKFSNVEAYLYNASPDSLFTSGELITALGNGMNIYDFMKSGVAPTAEEDGDEEGGISQPDEILSMGASEVDAEPEDDAEIELGTPEEAEQRKRDAEDEKIIPTLKLMKTKDLIAKDYSDKVLKAYLNKLVLRHILRNNFDYADRDNLSNKLSLRYAVLLIGNFHYIAISKGLYEDIEGLLQGLLSRIADGQDEKDRAKILLGILDDIDNSNLSYDTIPTKEQMLSYISKYTPDVASSVIPETPIADIPIESGIGYDGYDNYVEPDEYSNGGYEYGEPDEYSSGSNDGYGNSFETEADEDDYEFAFDSNTGEQVPVQAKKQNIFKRMANRNQNAGPIMPAGKTSDSESNFAMIMKMHQMREEREKAQQLNNARRASEEQIRREQLYRRAQIHKTPIFDDYNQQVAWETDKNNVNHFDPRSTMDVLVMSLDSYVNVGLKKSFKPLNTFKKALFESKNGTAYEFRKRWQFILDGIEQRFIDKSVVSKVYIHESLIIVNNKQILVDQLLGGDYGLELKDVVNFKSLLKRFPLISELMIDELYISNLYSEYGDTAKGLWDNMFIKNRNLKVLGFYTRDDKHPVVVRRENYASMADKLNDMFGFAKTKDLTEAVVASKNPKLHTKPIGYKAKALAHNTLEFADKHPSVKKGAKFGVGAAAAIGVVSLIGLPYTVVALAGGAFLKSGMQKKK